MIKKEQLLQKVIELNAFLDENSNTVSGDAIKEYKSIKSSLSGALVAEKLGVNIGMLQEFEVALHNFNKYSEDETLSVISSLRLSSWLETISQTSGIDLRIELINSNSSYENGIKQVRALELMLRDVIQKHTGGEKSLVEKISSFLKEDVVQKWVKSSDESGLLSGTTFSELSSLFLDKRLFASYDELFPRTKGLLYDKKKERSLRYFLDDIRIIRNSIAHNKKLSDVKLELLNVYYVEIASKIDEANEANKTSISSSVYLEVSDEQIKEFSKRITEDLNEVKEGVLEVSKKVDNVLKDTSNIKKTTSDILADTSSNKSMLKYIALGVILVLGILGAVLFLSYNSDTKTNQIVSNTETIKNDLKDVKEIVSGDAEIKNMSNSGDLTVTKDLNERTKGVDAKKIAIIYFDNTSEEKQLERLKKGLASMLISDLSNINMIDIVERDRIEELIKEQKLNNSKKFDPNTATKIGKLLGAEMILTGSYFEMYGSFRIDARFIDVETGEILKSEGVDGQTTNIFKLQKQLAWKIIKNLDLVLTDEEKKALQEKEGKQEISYENALLYAEALDDKDNGDFESAKRKLEAVLLNNEKFEPAIEELNKLNQPEV